MRSIHILAATLLLTGCVAVPPAPSASEQQEIAEVQTYLDNLTQFKAHFAQTGSDGATDGYVWLDRPGRLRVAYARPAPKLILANHGRLLLVDELSGATTNMPLSRTPLDILLAPHVQLTGGTLAVTDVHQAPGVLQFSVEKAASPGQGRLTLRFTTGPLRLTGVVVQDGTGRTNTLALDTLETGGDFSPSLFLYSPASPPSG